MRVAEGKQQAETVRELYIASYVLSITFSRGYTCHIRLFAAIGERKNTTLTLRCWAAGYVTERWFFAPLIAIGKSEKE